MRPILALMAFVLAASVQAQNTDFDIQVGGPCAVTFPSPMGAGGDPEGISTNGAGIATVDVDNGCGFPASGTQYLRVVAETGSAVGEVTVGGTPPTTLLATTNQVFLPVPPGASMVSLLWDFYHGEAPSEPTFNDGMMIDFIDAGGNQLSVIAFADTFTPQGICLDGVGDPGNPPTTAPTACGNIDVSQGSVVVNNPEVDPLAAGPGAEFVNLAAVPTGAAFLRIAVWNGGDDFIQPFGVVDAVGFVGATPATYPGTGEDLISTVDVNGAGPGVVGGGNDVLVIAPGDFVQVNHSSPGGTFVGIGDFVSVGSVVITPNPLPSPFPGIYLDPTTTFVVIGGTVGGFPYLLPFAGTGFSFVNSGTLAGLSFGVQAFVITGSAGNMIFASTNALELQLN